MKLNDTRITVFQEDYNPQRKVVDGKVVKDGKVLYKKGNQYAIHFKVLEKIKKRGAKFTSERLDLSKFRDEIKARQLKKAA